MSTGLPPGTTGIGLSFAGIQGHVSSQSNIPRQYPAAAPGPFSGALPHGHDQTPHIPFSNDKYVPPHRNTFHQSRYPLNSFPEIPLREPNPIPSIKFSGACAKLETFLLDIREQFHIFKDCFTSDKACINWVAHHF